MHHRKVSGSGGWFIWAVVGNVLAIKPLGCVSKLLGFYQTLRLCIKSPSYVLNLLECVSKLLDCISRLLSFYQILELRIKSLNCALNLLECLLKLLGYILKLLGCVLHF